VAPAETEPTEPDPVPAPEPGEPWPVDEDGTVQDPETGEEYPAAEPVEAEPADEARTADIADDLEADIADGAGENRSGTWPPVGSVPDSGLVVARAGAHHLEADIAPSSGIILPDRTAVAAGAEARADRSELAARMAAVDLPAPPEPVETDPAETPAPASSGADPWDILADIGEAGGIRVRVVVGRDGTPTIDARRFVDSRRYSGPTRKGFATGPEAGRTLAALLLEAADVAEMAGR
jgi:hypothetical protein